MTADSLSDPTSATPETILMDAQTLAEACRDAMWADDISVQSLGVRIAEVGPGSAIAEMTVTKEMSNGHGTCHGGYLFFLADTAFAYACNSHNPVTVAQHCSITFIAPGRLGSTLVATATEQRRFGRNGIYDVQIAEKDGPVIAEFRGHSRSVKGQLVPKAVLQETQGLKEAAK